MIAKRAFARSVLCLALPLAAAVGASAQIDLSNLQLPPLRTTPRLDSLEDRLSPDNPPVQRIGTLWALADAFRRHDIPVALDYLGRAERLADSLGDARAQSRTHLRRADALLDLGDRVGAAAAFDAALAVVGDRDDLGLERLAASAGAVRLRPGTRDSAVALLQAWRAAAEQGGELRDDVRLQQQVNRFARRTAVGIATRYGDQIVRLVSETVRRWDATTLTDRVESAVGRDLQFIRINGTLVGGLVGLTLHGLMEVFG